MYIPLSLKILKPTTQNWFCWAQIESYVRYHIDDRFTFTVISTRYRFVTIIKKF